MRQVGAAHWLFAHDERLCLQLNRASRVVWLRSLLCAAGRLGNGMAW
jgi:hypothetical protein